MTLLLADIAAYQGALTLADLRRAGFAGVNIKVSHGLTDRAVHPRAGEYAREARAAGMPLSSFHWLTGTASGREQADYAYSRMKFFGLHLGAAHVVDVEQGMPDGPDEQIYRDYVARMSTLLGRPIITYTGAWWWKPRGWSKAEGSPWLWAAPNAGYQPDYPGDGSTMWDAGYGGWGTLSVMQFRVAPVAGIDVSQSAVRSLPVWSQMTGGTEVASWVLTPSLVALRSEFNALSPARDKGADGSIGDSSHTSVSDHTPDEDSDYLRDHDADTKNEVHALDIDSSGPWPGGRSFNQIILDLVARERAEYESATMVGRLKYVIWNRRIASRSNGWSWVAYSGADPHTNHAHFSGRYESGPEADTRPWGVRDEEDDVTKEEFTAWMTDWAKSADGQEQLRRAVVNAPMKVDGLGDSVANQNVLVSIRNNAVAARAAAEKAAANITPVPPTDPTKK